MKPDYLTLESLTIDDVVLVAETECLRPPTEYDTPGPKPNFRVRVQSAQHNADCRSIADLKRSLETRGERLIEFVRKHPGFFAIAFARFLDRPRSVSDHPLWHELFAERSDKIIDFLPFLEGHVLVWFHLTPRPSSVGELTRNAVDTTTGDVLA